MRTRLASLRRSIERVGRWSWHAPEPRHLRAEHGDDRRPTRAGGPGAGAGAAVVAVTAALLAAGSQVDTTGMSGTGGAGGDARPAAPVERGDQPVSRRDRSATPPAEKPAGDAAAKPKADPKAKPKADPKGKPKADPKGKPKRAKPTPPPWAAPVHRAYRITSGFGRRWGARHGGLDIAAPKGTPIRTVRAGMVERAGWYGGYGKVVIVNHGGGVKTLYGHNAWLLVKPGQRLDIGQPVSLLGSTGRSTGPHLHLEVRVHGEKVDPLPYLRGRGVKL